MENLKLRNYAKLIVKMGVNVRQGQDVVINADLDQPKFIAMLVDECYKAGASRVDVQWNYQPLTKIHTRHRTAEELATFYKWELERLEQRANDLPATIHIVSEDPDGLKGIAQKKFSKANAMRRQIIKPYRDRMDNKYQWCVAAVPGLQWAKKLFPDVKTSKLEETLWEYILKASRADSDPIKQWKKHNAELKKRCEYLNSLKIRRLHYSSSNGTSFTVGIPDGARFVGGAEPTLDGTEFNANIPSEEVFTSPLRNDVNGKIVASMPLSYQGELIENFWFEFKDGKVVDYYAEKNPELLESLLKMDEGSSYLGEVALVPYDSPIRQTGILFYNTLFDENAACHFALGDSYPETLRGFENMSQKELFDHGLNNSIIHVDFMVGTKDLNITALLDNGEKADIFKHGNWAEYFI